LSTHSRGVLGQESEDDGVDLCRPFHDDDMVRCMSSPYVRGLRRSSSAETMQVGTWMAGSSAVTSKR